MKGNRLTWEEKGPAIHADRRAFEKQRCYKVLIADAAPDLGRVNGLIRVQLLRLLKKDIRRFRIDRVGNAAVINRADGRTLRFVEMANAFGATIVCNHVNIIADSLAITHMISLRFRIAA